MNDQVEGVVEQYNANHDALARTQAAQADTERRIAKTERDLAASQQQLDQRVWAIYTSDAGLTGLEALLNSTSLHDALATARYQEEVVSADQAAIDTVESAKRGLETLAGQLAAQRRTQQNLDTHLAQQHNQIGEQLAAQRHYFDRLNVAVRRTVAEERRRQEEALARRWGRCCWSGGSGTAARAATWALRQLGKPYQWGATGPRTFDCSGLTQTAYRHAGLSIPRVSRDQWNAGPHVSRGNLQRGDLVFFANDTSDPATIHHVGMYLGGGLMVEAPFTGAKVRISSVGRNGYIGAVRPTG
jgi:cell wall-associated NlpC family hydrolase